MYSITQAEFRRLGYSGGDLFAEVEVRADEWRQPLVATFKQEADGTLTLVSVAEKQEDPLLDWYENNLHDAFPNIEEQLFQGAASERAQFEKAVLAFENMQEIIEDKLYYRE